ncbi:MAG: alkaline phosphatase PhoX [Pseudomonadota bacterium]
MSHSRRHFLHKAWAMAAAAPAYSALSACSMPGPEGGDAPNADLVPDPEGFLDLPPGFAYQRLSEVGALMSDGYRVPGAHDGMGCFAMEGDTDRCVLIRNHELSLDETDDGPFQAGAGVPDGVDPAAIFDIAPNGDPVAGGTTTLIYNLRTQQLEQSFLSLVGTERNCSGGITPWGSWLTCEESRSVPGDAASQHHGYAFEVPASARGLVRAEPLRAMGRFNREAAAVDPRTGIVYQTEDSGTGLLYRFIPDHPGALQRGGRLQALAIIGRPAADTRNWDEAGPTFVTGQSHDCLWIDLDDVEALQSPLQERGYDKGAAWFARGEGIAWAVDQAGSAAYFACTSGGRAQGGQIWRYVPSPYEGTAREAESPGKLILHYESADRGVMDMCDNIVPSPWGHLVICEDGPARNAVKGVTPEGRVYTIAETGVSEVAGACFSPDENTLFFNVQKVGVTVAVTGPWARLAVA